MAREPEDNYNFMVNYYRLQIDENGGLYNNFCVFVCVYLHNPSTHSITHFLNLS